MLRKAYSKWLFVALTALIVAGLSMGSAVADPLKGRDVLKFSQKPMIATPIPDVTGQVNTYFGHDELSTAYSFGTPAGQRPVYQGRFMADDFADRFDTPVVHVKWWGSYFRDIINPNTPLKKFLISFERDVPASSTDPNSFSHPGVPILNQVVDLGALARGSGTYTETLIRGPDPFLGESLYEYNAELHLGKDFPQEPDTVYWLKIVALVDLPVGITFDPINPPDNVTRWGWHNRDYTIFDPLASVPPAVAPGEHVDGIIGPPAAPTRVWHFQDDAVTGVVSIDTTLTTDGLIMPHVSQDLFAPTNYIDGFDGPPPLSGFSKDLAFELYTIPEPGTCLLMLCGVLAQAVSRRNGRNAT